MKTILRFFLIASIITLFASCTKVIDVPQPPVAIHPLKGSWEVNHAEENGGDGWHTYSPVFDAGIFDLYDNGLAEYSDAKLTFDGSWYTTFNAHSYYDENGNLYNDTHESLTILTTDSYSGTPLNVFFDYINILNNSTFVATYFDGQYVYRVTFSKY